MNWNFISAGMGLFIIGIMLNVVGVTEQIEFLIVIYILFYYVGLIFIIVGLMDTPNADKASLEGKDGR